MKLDKPIDEIAGLEDIGLIRLHNDEMLITYVTESQKDPDNYYLVYPAKLLVTMDETNQFMINMYDWMPSMISGDECFPIRKTDILTMSGVLPDIKDSYLKWCTRYKQRLSDTIMESEQIMLLKGTNKPKLNVRKRKNKRKLDNFLDPDIQNKVIGSNVHIPPKKSIN